MRGRAGAVLVGLALVGLSLVALSALAKGWVSSPSPVALVASTPGSTPGTTVGEPLTLTLVGAGDIASCDSPGDEATALLLDDIPGTVFTAGDNVYPDGTSAEFADCFDPSWGRHRERTRPAPGNHDYETAGAAGYFGYFGAAAGDPSKGYYAYDLGAWRIYVLNSNCTIVTCITGSGQERWLRADLAAEPRACVAAIAHHALFSSGPHGGSSAVRPLWRALHDAGVELVVSGHDHLYERFAPQTPRGELDPERGIIQFVAGMGGRSHYAFETIQPNHAAGDDTTYGVLRLDLSPGGYLFAFVAAAGGTYTDGGAATCH